MFGFCLDLAVMGNRCDTRSTSIAEYLMIKTGSSTEKAWRKRVDDSSMILCLEG
jgi:hypothetical protein